MTTTTQVKAITRADVEELRWLGRELLADHVNGMDAGESAAGAFGDVHRLIDYAQALGSLGTESDLASDYWITDLVIRNYPVIEPMAEGSIALEHFYRETAEESGHTTRLRGLADRIAKARGILYRLRREYRRMERA